MGLVVGQKIMLRQVISLLRQDGEGPQADTAKAALSTSGTDILPGFILAEELSKLEAEFMPLSRRRILSHQRQPP